MARGLFDLVARATAVEGPGWPRPPGALAEAAFLAKCTRCDACVQACPHGAIGKLPDGDSVGTPAMNPNIAPCHLCDGLPCVQACEDGALVDAGLAGVFLGLAVVDEGRCLPFLGPECGACRSSCPVGALTTSLGRPSIDTTTCNGCGLCRADCPVWDKAIDIEWQG